VELFADAVEAETGRRPVLSTTGGTSDARFIKDHCPVLEFGLVGQTMHQVDERVAVADLEPAGGDLPAVFGIVFPARGVRVVGREIPSESHPVIPGLDPGIQSHGSALVAGSSPAMTRVGPAETTSPRSTLSHG
jgi:hypothetical protein